METIVKTIAETVETIAETNVKTAVKTAKIEKNNTKNNTKTKKTQIVKCRFCGKEGEKGIMQSPSKSKYYHDYCYPKYILQKEREEKEKIFREEESKELDKLVHVIKEIHGVVDIPRQFFPFLMDVRNGTFIRNSPKYKKGVEYSLIADTFIYCKDKIKWSKQNKQFANTMAELKYGLAIVRNNFEKVIQLKTRNERGQVEKQKIIKEAEMLKNVDIVIKQNQQNQQNDTLNNNKNNNNIDLTTIFD